MWVKVLILLSKPEECHYLCGQSVTDLSRYFNTGYDTGVVVDEELRGKHNKQTNK